jgi:hypothetical protein
MLSSGSEPGVKLLCMYVCVCMLCIYVFYNKATALYIVRTLYGVYCNHNTMHSEIIALYVVHYNYHGVYFTVKSLRYKDSIVIATVL